VATGNVLHEVAGPQLAGPLNANRARSLAVSQDASILAAAFGRGSQIPVALFSTKDWTKIRDLDNVRLRFSAALSFAGNGGRFAAASMSDIWVVETNTGNLVRHISPGRAAVSLLAMNGDGTLIAFNEGNAIRVVNVDDGQVIAEDQPERHVNSIAWDPDGRFLVSIGYSAVHLWNPFGGGRDEKTIELRPLVGGLAVAPGGHRVAVGNGGYTSIFSIEK